MKIDRIQQNRIFLTKIVLEPKKSERTKLLAVATNEELLALADILMNAENGNFYLSVTQRAKLKLKQKLVRQLTKPKLSHHRRRALFKKLHFKFKKTIHVF